MNMTTKRESIMAIPGTLGFRSAAIATAAALFFGVSLTAVAQEALQEAASLENAFKEDSFSPYAIRNFPSSVFFGDTDVHSSIPMDAVAKRRTRAQWVLPIKSHARVRAI